MNDTKIEDLKKSLRHERTFVEAEHRNKIIDSIVKKIEYVDVFYIRSENPANSVKFLDNDAIIVWDENYWDIFAECIRLWEWRSRFITGIKFMQCSAIRRDNQ